MEKTNNNPVRRALPAALLTVFIDAVGVAIIIPVYILLVLPGPQRVIPAGWSLQSGFIFLGWLTGIYSLCVFLAAPLLGELSDRYGRKPVLAISLFGTAISYALFAFGIREHSIALLIAGRALDGITGGNIAVARAVIGDISDKKTRVRNYGLIGAMFGIGFVLGPYLGGRLASPGIPLINIFGHQLLRTPSWFNAQTPFWFAMILSLIDVVVILFVLPETLRKKINNGRLHLTQSFHNIARAFRLPDLRPIFATSFLFSSGFTFFTTFFGINLARRLGFAPSNIADFFSYIGICIAVMQGVVVPLIARKFTIHRVLQFSFFGLSLAILGLFLPKNTTQLLLIAPAIPLFVAPIMANMISLVSTIAGPDRQGEVMGINSSVEALAQGIPAVLSGYLASIYVGLPLIVSAITLTTAGTVFCVFVKKSKLPKELQTLHGSTN